MRGECCAKNLCPRWQAAPQATQHFAMHSAPQRFFIERIFAAKVVEAHVKSFAASRTQHPLHCLRSRFDTLEICLLRAVAPVRFVPVAKIDTLAARLPSHTPMRDLVQRTLKVVVTKNNFMPTIRLRCRLIQGLVTSGKQPGAVRQTNGLRKKRDNISCVVLHGLHPSVPVECGASRRRPLP